METGKPKIYRKYIIVNKKGKALLYLKIYKALYLLLRSAILFYSKQVKYLEDLGLEINPLKNASQTR